MLKEFSVITETCHLISFSVLIKHKGGPRPICLHGGGGLTTDTAASHQGPSKCLAAVLQAEEVESDL